MTYFDTEEFHFLSRDEINAGLDDSNNRFSSEQYEQRLTQDDEETLARELYAVVEAAHQSVVLRIVRREKNDFLFVCFPFLSRSLMPPFFNFSTCFTRTSWQNQAWRAIVFT